jgi:hypothetical protein
MQRVGRGLRGDHPILALAVNRSSIAAVYRHIHDRPEREDEHGLSAASLAAWQEARRGRETVELAGARPNDGLRARHA